VTTNPSNIIINNPLLKNTKNFSNISGNNSCKDNAFTAFS